MQSGLESPSKLLYWFDWIICFFLLAWFTNYGTWLIYKDLDKYTIISIGILLFIYSLTKIIKPNIFPKAQIIYSSPVTDTFVIWSFAMLLILCASEIRWIKLDPYDRWGGHILDAYKEPIIVKLIVTVIVLIIIFALWNKAHVREKENKKIIDLKALLKIVLIGVPLIIMWLILGNWLASRMEKEVEQEWAKNYLPFEYVRRLEPSKSKNKSAKKIEELALKFSIYLKEENWQENSSYQQRKSVYDELNNGEWDYLLAQIQKPDNIVDKPPSKLKKYFENHEKHFLALEDYVLTHEPPVWASGTYEGIKDSWLDVVEMMSLQRVLIVCTFAMISDSKYQDALKMLETAWKLNLFLKNEPDFWAWAGSDVHLGWYAGVLRKMENVPSCWRDRLNSDSYEKHVFLTIQKQLNYYYDYETVFNWNLYFIPPSENLKKDYHYIEWYTIGLLLKPYYRLCISDISRKILSDIMLFRNHKACDFIPYYYRAPSKISYSYWNKLFYFYNRFSEPLHDEPLARLNQLLIRNELTQKILLIKELKASSPYEK